MNKGGMVIWVTGLSGAGKTTLCSALYERLRGCVRGPVLLDGDAVRAVWEDQLGYSEDDRARQIRRLQGLARLLAGQGLAVIVAALYARADLLASNRATLPGYFEVYLDAPEALVRRRDSKGLYAAALAGEMSDVVGVDIPWNPPEAPDLTLDANAGATAAALADQVIRALPGPAAAGAGRAAVA